MRSAAVSIGSHQRSRKDCSSQVSSTVSTHSGKTSIRQVPPNFFLNHWPSEGPVTTPITPASSSDSSTAVCSAVLPGSIKPLGIDHSPAWVVINNTSMAPSAAIR